MFDGNAYKTTFTVNHKIKIMKNLSSPKFLSAIITIAFFLVPVLAIAQDPGGGPDAPIDGGLSLLLAAGAANGVKKYRDGRIPKIKTF